MSMTRLKIFDGDTAEIVEGKVNAFIEKYVYAVERIQVYPKKEESIVTGGYYVYLTYRKKYDNGEKD